MPRLKTRDLRKRFSSLYRFIETDLTEANWHDLTKRAARADVPPYGPIRKRAHVWRPRGAARWTAIAYDIDDLAAARALQARLREEIAAIARGETWPSATNLTRLIEHRFARLKRILTCPPLYVEDRGNADARIMRLRGFVYRERVKRDCPSCGRTYTSPPGAKRTSCGERACAIDVDNTRRRQRRKTR